MGRTFSFFLPHMAHSEPKAPSVLAMVHLGEKLAEAFVSALDKTHGAIKQARKLLKKNVDAAALADKL